MAWTLIELRALLKDKRLETVPTKKLAQLSRNTTHLTKETLIYERQRASRSTPRTTAATSC